jgi:hypothetical protein
LEETEGDGQRLFLSYLLELIPLLFLYSDSLDVVVSYLDLVFEDYFLIGFDFDYCIVVNDNLPDHGRDRLVEHNLEEVYADNVYQNMILKNHFRNLEDFVCSEDFP